MSGLQITTDTRQCPEGSLFIALKGATFNGNQFAQKALEQGCAYTLVDEPEYATDERIILVPDCLQAYKDLARQHRRQFQIPVIGITGTNGKTTTKELLAAVLQEKYNVHYTQGNFNNDVGVPKTLMGLNSSHEIAIIEMGASHPGDIKTLVETAEPTCGLITNVGRAHLQGFGSFEGVKQTKGELYDFLKANGGEVFVDATNPDLCAMAAERNIDAHPYTEGEIIACDPFLRFSWRGHEVKTHLIGSYNIINMLAAATVGLRFGVSEEQICHALSSYVPQNNRSQLTVTPHNQLVVDAYNANPTSMAAAIHNFDSIVTPLRKMAILGSMGELGDVSRAEHTAIVELLRQQHIDDVWLVGSEFAAIAHPYRQFADVEAVQAAIRQSQPQDSLILIKGSNSQRLFLLPEIL